MTLLRIMSRKRVGCRHFSVTILLSIAVSLSLGLITPAIAQDECQDTGRVANGGAEWYFPGYGETAASFSGRSQFHIKECKGNQPVKGWVYNNNTDSDEWILVSIAVEGGATKVVYGRWWTLAVDGTVAFIDGDAAWVLGQIIDSNNQSLVGSWAYGAALDGGTPGRNGDVLFLVTKSQIPELENYLFASILYNQGILQNQILPFWAPLVKGNIQITGE